MYFERKCELMGTVEILKRFSRLIFVYVRSITYIFLLKITDSFFNDYLVINVLIKVVGCLLKSAVI